MKSTILLSSLVVMVACGDDGGVSTCVPGATASCACLVGTGVQECLEDGTFGECRCPMDGMDAGPTPGVDGGPTPGVDGGPTPGVDGGPTPGVDGGPTPGVDGGPTPGVDGGPTPDVDAGPPGTGPGHVVLMGAHMWNPDDSFDRMFANAIFLSERPGDLDVVEYTEHFTWGGGWEMHAHEVMDAEAMARGRRIVRTSLTSATRLAAALATADVFFIPAQNADEGELMTVAAFWHDPLVAFVEAGGVVVVLSPSLLGGSSRDFEWRLVDAPEFFGFGVGTPPGFSSGMATPFEITDASDPLAAGVLSPWATNAGQMQCFPGSTRGRVVARSIDSLCPMVRHLER